MSTLYEVILAFWQFWFGEHLNADIYQLLCLVSTLAIVWVILLRPILKLITNFGKRGN